MSRKQKAVRYAAKEISRLLALFGETGWKFDVVFEKDMRDVAQVRVYRQRYCFLLAVGPAFLRESPEERKNTMLHEALHILQMKFWHQVEFALRQTSLGASEHRAFAACFDQQVELVTDQLASALAGRI